ncbi:glycosyltransferase family 39 protein [Laspinema sp. D1]|uniref:Glycosyltransferase family 39 protein n=1 Tax=Laspinema palackyanum D2a TaxID=2953684 RepID=A0ABT2MMH2_9CYAN|nr:glycosyltransferase family 39 protein [Laspinema sp. D2a]
MKPFSARNFRWLVCFILILGFFFRFYNIDQKIYWEDETYSSLRISGYTADMVISEVYTGELISREFLHQTYQPRQPKKDVNDALKALASSPEHSPLYYLMARFLVDKLGHSVTLMRGLSAVISIMAFPCMYWLCRELFDKSLTGWVAIALVAVSPFHVLYAQEARQSSLFIVTILLSSAALLQAIRLQKYKIWFFYSATVVLGIYSHLIFALVAISHGIYILIRERFRISKITLNYLLASGCSVIAFTPWIWIVATNYQKVTTATSWTAQSVSLISLGVSWLGNLSRLFFDVNINSRAPLQYLIPSLIPIIGIVILGVYSLYYLNRRTQNNQDWFVFSLIGVTAIFLIVPDLLFGGQRSMVPRYLIPCYLGIQIAVAYLLSRKMTESYKNPLHQKQIWQMVTFLLILGGIVSCGVSAQSTVWWSKGFQSAPQMARLINQNSAPLLISDEAVGGILSLTYLLEDHVQFQLVQRPNLPTIPTGFSDVYLYSQSPILRNLLAEEEGYSVLPINSRDDFEDKLWKIEKN